MNTLLGLALALTVGTSVWAAPITCEAKVTIHRWRVTVDNPGTYSPMSVVTDTGARYGGIANYSYSPKMLLRQYYLALDPNTGLAFQVEEGGQNRMALCLKPTECYACR